jgi:hypothetical protein
MAQGPNLTIAYSPLSKEGSPSLPVECLVTRFLG